MFELEAVPHSRFSIDEILKRRKLYTEDNLYLFLVNYIKFVGYRRIMT